MNDMRDMRGMDGRRLPPRNSRGEFRRRRGDRGMYPQMQGDGRVIRSYPTMYPQGDYARGDMNYDMARGGQYGNQSGRGRGDRGDYGDYNMGQDMRGGDYRGGDYRGGQMSDMRMGDGHHYPEHQMGGQTYYPIEAMGRFNGYWGMPQGDYGYRRDYGYDYGYDYGDYGETLSEQELESWNKRLMEQLDEREKQMFHKDTIMQKIKQMGKPMEGFGEKELYTATLMSYTDDKEFIGQNIDLALKLGYAFLTDKDTKVRGAEKLAVYYDCIVEGE